MSVIRSASKMLQRIASPKKYKLNALMYLIKYKHYFYNIALFYNFSFMFYSKEKSTLKKTALNIERLMHRAVGEALMVHNNQIGKGSSPPRSDTVPTCDMLVPMNPSQSGISIDDFTILKTLGKGSFGKVFLVVSKASENYYALKAMRKDHILEQDDFRYALIERDIYALGKQNRFLTQLICSFQNEVDFFSNK